MRFSLQSKVRIYSGHHSGYLSRVSDVTKDPAEALVVTLEEALDGYTVVTDAMQLQFELVGDESGT